MMSLMSAYCIYTCNETWTIAIKVLVTDVVHTSAEGYLNVNVSTASLLVINDSFAG